LDICAGTTVTAADLFGALTGTPDAGGTWSPVLAGAGTYTYIVAAIAPCATDATSTVTVTEQAAPDAGANGTLDICAGTTVTTADLFGVLTGTPQSGGTWSPALAGAGTYTYTVAATAPCATDATAQVILTVSNCEIVIPSGFTPSGDGVNETWELIGLDDKYPNNKVYIYNRWGNLIFESKQGDYMSQPWDGTYEGKPLPVSSFYYMIYTDPEQEGEVIKGTLSILKK
jgi:gliding motility-associated-like protein